MAALRPSLQAFVWHTTLAQIIGYGCCSRHEADRIDNDGLSLLQVRMELTRSSNMTMQVVGSTRIPCYIHQTWKTSNVSQLESWMKKSATSWKNKNPECRHTIWSDDEVEKFIQTNYPEVAVAWPVLKPIERADLFRYAVVHKLGGFYSDIDAMDVFPISSWDIPADTELVVGYDSDDMRRLGSFTRSEHFEQWFFGAVPGHPVLKECLSLFQEKRQWGIEDVEELTGSGSFSDSVHEYFWSAVANKTGQSIGEAETTMQQLLQNGSQAMIFPPGPGPEGSHVFILSADQVSARGSSSQVSSKAPIRHTFQGTWKEKSIAAAMGWP